MARVDSNAVVFGGTAFTNVLPVSFLFTEVKAGAVGPVSMR